MKFLLVFKQKKNLDTFRDTITRLLAGGHEIVLAMQDQDAVHDQRLLDRLPSVGLTVVAAPTSRGDGWRASASSARSIRDWAQYLKPQYAGAAGLRQRTVDNLRKEFAIKGDLVLPLVEAEAARLLNDLLRHVETAIPSDPLHEEFIARHQPDVVIVTPGLHFGSGQADFIRSARAIGVPAWMLLFSWDNLSTKGALHVAPDLLFVWNERQRQEAVDLHGFPGDRVVVVGAPRFDEFFTLRSQLARADFFQPLGLDPDRPTLLYLCSSRFVAARELPFIRRWLATVRHSTHAGLRDCNVIVRPHPDVVLVEGEDSAEVRWPALAAATGHIQRPFADPAALVLRTKYRAQQAFYECLHHAEAVVGLNTSAELEAGIAGRPVLTVVADDEAVSGQSTTLHFNYLLREQGGFVVCAPNLATHVAQLEDAVDGTADPEDIRRFIASFLRPHGNRPVSDVLAEMLVSRAATAEGRAARSGLPISNAVRGVPGAEAEVTNVDDGSGEGSDDGPDGRADGEVTRVLRLDYPGSTAQVFATPETRGARRRGVLKLDPATVTWLGEHVHPGEVLYDIGAGIGAYALAAAMSRGSLVVAFEPGFATFTRLCDNVLANACTRSVIPLSVALGDRTGLLELEYRREAGGEAYTLRTHKWRALRDRREARYAQPVCAERLDDLVTRHGLPQPHAMRLAAGHGTEAVLAGARLQLARSELTAILLYARDAAQAETVSEILGTFGFAPQSSAAARHDRWTVTLVRTAEASPRPSP
jgi:FkbM family methyltransferase